MATAHAGHKTKVDWKQIKAEYISNPTVSQLELSKKYGVNKTTLGQRAVKEKWTQARERAYEKASARVEEQVVNDIVKANQRHTQTYKNLQSVLLSQMNIMAEAIKDLQNKAAANGGPVPITNLFDQRQLKAMADALKTSLDGERITLGLPTGVQRNEITGADGKAVVIELPQELVRAKRKKQANKNNKP